MKKIILAILVIALAAAGYFVFFGGGKPLAMTLKANRNLVKAYEANDVEKMKTAYEESKNYSAELSESHREILNKMVAKTIDVQVFTKAKTLISTIETYEEFKETKNESAATHFALSYSRLNEDDIKKIKELAPGIEKSHKKASKIMKDSDMGDFLSRFNRAEYKNKKKK